MFLSKSSFPISPNIFGCVCFVRGVRPHYTKLDPKSLKYIFLDYSQVQMGYCCYCPTLNMYLVSPEVAFFETLPFSQSLSSPSQGENDNLFLYEITSHHPFFHLHLCLFPPAHLFVVSTPGVLHSNLQNPVRPPPLTSSPFDPEP